MRNKLFILTLASFLAFSGFSQGVGESLDQQPAISVYPNPAVEYLMVQVDSDLKNAKFELNSMIGNKLVIQPEEMGNGKYRIPVKQLATGYYFLIVKNEDKRFKKAFKFLKN